MWRLLIANRTYPCQSRRTIKYITLDVNNWKCTIISRWVTHSDKWCSICIYKSPFQRFKSTCLVWDLGACSNQKRLHTFTISICKESNEWLLITDCMHQQHHHKRIFKSLFSIMEIQNPKRKGCTYPPSSWISDNWGRRTGTPLSVCLLRQIGNCIWKVHQPRVKNHDFNDAYSSVLTCQHLANVLFDIDWTHSIKCRDNRLKLQPYVG